MAVARKSQRLFTQLAGKAATARASARNALRPLRTAGFTLAMLAVPATVSAQGPASDQAEARADAPREAGSLLQEADQAVAMGDLAQAADLYERAQELANASADTFSLARAAAGLGAVFKARGQLPDAILNLDQAARLLEGTEEQAWLGVVLYETGQIELQRGRHSRAAAALSGAVQAFSRVRDIQGDANLALRWQAAALMAHGHALRPDDPDAASRRFDKAANLFARLGDMLTEGDAWYAKGLTDYDQRAWSRAADAFDTALRAYRQGDDPLGAGLSQAALGRVRIAEGQYEDAASRFKLAIGELERIEDAIQDELVARYGLAESQLALGRSEDALATLQEAQKLVDKLGSAEWRGHVERMKGRALRLTARSGEALASYQAALAAYGPTGEEDERTECLVALGELNLAAGRGDKGLAAFQEAIALGRASGEVKALAQVGLAEALVVEGKVDEAEAALADAIAALPPTAQQARGRALRVRGTIAEHRGGLSDAHGFFDEAARLLDKAGDPLGAGQARLADGRIYVHEREERRARKVLEEAVRYFVAAGAKGLQADARMSFGEVLAATGKSEDAMLEWKLAGDLYTELGRSGEAGLARLAVARLQHVRGQSEEALQAAQAALAGLDSGGAPETVPAQAADAALLVGEIELGMGVAEGMPRIQRAAAIADAHGVDAVRAAARVRLGELHLARAEVQEAATHFEAALGILQPAGTSEALADATYGLGRARLAQGDKAAVPLLEAARGLYKDLGNSRRAREAKKALQDAEAL